MCWSESVKVKMQHTAHTQQWWTLYLCLDHSVFHISSWYKCYGWIFKRNTEWRSSCKLYMTDVHICISNLQSSIYWAIAAIQQHVFHSQLGISIWEFTFIQIYLEGMISGFTISSERLLLSSEFDIKKSYSFFSSITSPQVERKLWL